MKSETPTTEGLQRGETLEFERFWQVVRTLRGVHGCPWDIEQTTETIKSNLIEEAYEALEAINDGDRNHLKEELGDIFLVVMLMICIEQQAGRFTLAEVFSNVADKLIRRHPHVFGDAAAESPDLVREQWDRIKSDVEGRGRNESVLNGVSKSLPSLERAYKLQKKAAKVGFDWPDIRGALDKLREEVDELEAALESREHSDDHECSDDKEEYAGSSSDGSLLSIVEHEVGDVLFSVINVARKAGIKPGESLHEANRRFSRRFSSIEQYFADRNQEMESVSLDQMEDRWQEAKRQEQAGGGQASASGTGQKASGRAPGATD